MLLAASASEVVGPSPSEFVTIIQEQGGSTANVKPKTIELRRCEPFIEEPTELSCDFRAQDERGAWGKRRAIVTYDKGWVLLGLE
jgi:hypothetical protein